ncbi:hypothetical protein M409DRAFT_24132 [Zasmidium cellare ATCC 36951]|uniref:DUF7626 domain-containing protein n=1 Tax=Zasmidium cellare ATCC 36951 TaxID=1080233 RepID=A0A6A6CKA7_ZASCE|nr:uncharacterized protein M409DRAFT_24132 [Zasmidium cellare ATCC 36951]KAF2165846.1 hypothetical protein M409DRAFT_24132 [Zasmidium cellare ATCC 36951]
MAFNLSWAGAPLPDFSDHEEDSADDAQLDNGSGSEADDGQYRGDYDGNSTGEIDDTFATSHAQSKGKGKGKKKSIKESGTAAVPKKLTLDPDTYDARLIELKRQGFTDEQVSQKLKDEGRIQYEAKTVGSRWMRLKKLLMQQEDERLDDELSDWHEGEDDQLNAIAKAVAPKFDHQIQLLEQRRWHEISLHLANKLGQRKYTGKACRERVEAVKNGTALPPIEQAKNAEERRRMRDERIAANKKARQNARDEQRAKEQRAQARAEAKKRDLAEATRKKIDDALQKRSDKETAERIKEERRINKEKEKQHKAAVEARFLAEKQWIAKRKQAEEDLYKELTGYNMGGKKPGRMRKGKDGYEEEEEEAEASDVYDSEEEDIIDLINDDDTDEEDAPGISDNDDDLAFFEPQPPAEEEDTTTTPKPRKLSTLLAPRAGHIPAPVTKTTLLNPRSILTDAELERLLFYRSLPRRGPSETHAEVVARLAANDETLKSDELSQLLMHLSEKSKGKKFEKISRLREADARECDAGQMGVRSTDLEFVRRYEGYSGEFAGLVREIVEEEGQMVE